MSSKPVLAACLHPVPPPQASHPLLLSCPLLSGVRRHQRDLPDGGQRQGGVGGGGRELGHPPAHLHDLPHSDRCVFPTFPDYNWRFGSFKAGKTQTRVQPLSLRFFFFFRSSPEKIGLPNVMFFHSAMCFALLVFVILCVPETKGLTLEEISKELAKK